MKVTPSLKNSAERTGAITDIRACKPVSTGPSRVSVESEKVERQVVGAGENPARVLLRSIGESGYPIEEDEMTISSLRSKISRGEILTREEDKLLHRLGDKAREWLEAGDNLTETVPRDTHS